MVFRCSSSQFTNLPIYFFVCTSVEFKPENGCCFFVVDGIFYVFVCQLYIFLFGSYIFRTNNIIMIMRRKDGMKRDTYVRTYMFYLTYNKTNFIIDIHHHSTTTTTTKKIEMGKVDTKFMK